jgi:hypothetical protein
MIMDHPGKGKRGAPAAHAKRPEGTDCRGFE